MRCTVFLVMAACSAPVHPRQADIVEASVDDFLRFEPTQGARMGLHEYDGKLPDRSPAGIATELSQLRTDREQLAKLIPATVDAQIELAALDVGLRGRIFELADLDVARRDPTSYADPIDPSNYIVHAYAPAPERAASLKLLCDALPAHLAQARTNLDRPLPRAMLEIAIAQTQGFAEFVDTDGRRELSGVPGITAILDTCKAAYAEHAAWLVTQRERATNEFSLGTERLLAMLRETQGIDVDLATLQRVAREDLARNHAAIEQAARAIDPAKTVAEVVANLERVPADKVIDTAAAQAEALRHFIVDHHIVTFETRSVALTRVAPPYERWNFAFLHPVGTFETGDETAYYYIAPPDPSWPPEEQRAYITPTAQLWFTTAHEVYPGHFVQFELLRRLPSRALRLFGMYTTMEGWAHYSEEMMYDAGVGDHAPDAHVGQLSSALLRDGRFVAALGLHSATMTQEQAEEMFRTETFADPATAKQQAARGTFDPMYLSYTLGKLIIRKLRDDYLARYPKKTLQNFHDAFLAHGGAPLPAIRRALLGSSDGLL